jgi:apolipoprotein N-acyltransferase
VIERGARRSALARARSYAPSLSVLAAFGSGALLPCAFAPLQFWALAILCPAALMLLWQGRTPGSAARLGFSFSAGTFAVGTYWLYTSIHTFGEAPIWIAVALMLALIAIMGAYQALLGWFVARFLPASGALRSLVGVPAAWLLLEWWRGWFATGFSWLSLGYSQTDTALASLAPVCGVYGVSAVCLVSAGAIVTAVQGGRRIRIAAAAIFVAPWVGALLLSRMEWTHPIGAPVKVAVIQGAIPQDQKWLDANRDTTLQLYRNLTAKVLGTPLIVWPESAPPDLANNLVDYLGEMYSMASARGSALIMGVVRESDDGEHYYNSVVALGEKGPEWYDKSHLVPFAEFFPVPGFVRSWLRLANLPYEDFTRGAVSQPPLSAAGLKLAASICYEDAYGSSQLAILKHADALVNVTNDAWFGHSTARHQHFQIARMRAIEAGRFMVRAANDGISGVIGPHGEVIARAPEFTPYALTAVITARAGMPPYAYVGNWPVLLLGVAGVAAAAYARRRALEFELRRT